MDNDATVESSRTEPASIGTTDQSITSDTARHRAAPVGTFALDARYVRQEVLAGWKSFFSPLTLLYTAVAGLIRAVRN